MKTVKQVSKLTGASVRTLQYYDNIGLLSPSTRSQSSYRLYSDEDVTKLQQILFLKSLGFSLKQIRELINHPDFDQRAIFGKQKELLFAESQRASKVIQILERLENGASFDDCAEENIKSISKESKSMKNSLKFTLFIALVIIVGAATAYFILQPSNTDAPVIANVPQEPALDVIHLNPLDTDGATKCYALDIVDIDESDLPINSPTLEQIILPEGLHEVARLEAFYPYKHETGDQVRNYIIKAFDDQRYVYIGFSPDRTPIREMYAPEGEPSIIGGQEVMIGSYTNQDYDTTDTAIESIEKYYIDFTRNGMNYSVETHGLSESEMVTLIKSLL